MINGFYWEEEKCLKIMVGKGLGERWNEKRSVDVRNFNTNSEYFMFCLLCNSIHPCNENQLDALFILSLSVSQLLHVSGIFLAHHQKVYFIYIYIYIYTHNNWHVLCFSVDYLLLGWNNSIPTRKTASHLKTQYVPIVVYIVYNFWWWATNMSETCRGWLTK